jgi:hypothetical protein
MAQDFSNASHVNIDNLTTSHANGNAVPVGRLVESERQGDDLQDFTFSETRTHTYLIGG